MFQRLKGAIDSRIAEEQARQRSVAQAGSPSRTLSNANRRQNLRPDVSPARRPSRQRGSRDVPTERGPDPSEFEPEFVIGDDSAAPSRIATPRPEVKEDSKDVAATGESGKQEPVEDQGQVDGKGSARAETPAPKDVEELPSDVRAKLRKYEKLEVRYQELLRAYRIAHARVLSIEPFEASLRENTPLTSINDPGALVEFLNQSTLKSDMVLEELKRVMNENNEYKKKYTEAEKTIESLKAEVEKTRGEQETPTDGASKLAEPKVSLDSVRRSSSVDLPAGQEGIKSPTSSITSRVPSLSLFSPKTKAAKPPHTKAASEDLFSYDGEIPRLEAEVDARQEEIEDLRKQVKTLRGDLSVARESTEGMVQSLESATRELNTLRDAKDRFEAEQGALRKEIDDLNTKAASDDAANTQSQAQADEERKAELQDRLRTLQRDFEAQESKLTEAARTIEDLRTSLSDSEKIASQLRSQVQQKDATVKDLEDSLALQKSAERQESDNKKVETLEGILATLRAQLKTSENDITDLRKRLDEQRQNHENSTGTKLFATADTRFTSDAKWQKARDQANDALEFLLNYESDSNVSNVNGTKPSSTEAAPAANKEAGSSSKKKNKKKKKGKGGQSEPTETSNTPVKVTEDLTADDEDQSQSKADTSLKQLEIQIEDLQKQLVENSTTIDSLTSKLKEQESLAEEIETLRDDLLHQGEEHVEARDQLKVAMAEKRAMQATIEHLEKDFFEAKEKAESSTAGSTKAHNDLLNEFEELKVKATSLETDLSAAQQLAAGRFKDIRDLRELLSKAQPELRNLRQEVTELKSAKDDLKNKSGELRRLESRHEDLKAEMKGLGKRIGDQDSEIKTLQQKVAQETSARSKAEEELNVAQSDLRSAEARRAEAVDAHSHLQTDHSKVREELQNLRTKVLGLESQISDFDRVKNQLNEEISLKTAQHASAQSLMSSMRDQTMELSTQMREVSSRAESLEEELSEAQRMLSERTREGETMRRLLSDVETRAETKVREMKERMETAIEERDRAEDEASTAGRRMAREVEDVKTKAREAQRALKRIEDDKEELEHSQKEWRRRREDLEQQNEHATSELAEIRKAMSQLRDALDESEKHNQDLERQKSELRRSSEETQTRLDKLQSSNKSLIEEIKSLQAQMSFSNTVNTGGASSSSQQNPRKPSTQHPNKPTPISSSRPSFDNSSRSPSRAPHLSRNNSSSTVSVGNTQSLSAAAATPPPPAQTIDYVYLKNVLLQFLEQKDKSHQRALIPVLAMLLRFDRQDEQKWSNAIATR